MKPGEERPQEGQIDEALQPAPEDAPVPAETLLSGDAPGPAETAEGRSVPGLAGPRPRRAPMTRRELLRTATLFYAVLVMIPLWWRAAGEGPNLFYPGGFNWPDTIGGLVTGLLAGLAVVGISGAAMRRTRWGRGLAEGFAEIVGGVSARDAWWLAACSALGEEMFFRGLLQPWLGLTATSLLFGFLHVIPRREMLPWTIFSLAAGFLLGWLFAFSGTLVAPIACHLLVNGINLTRIAALAPREESA